MRAECGELIRVVDAAGIAELEAVLPLPELVTFGSALLYRDVYDDRGELAGAVRFASADLVDQAAALARDLYERGEELDSYFHREVAPLAPPREKRPRVDRSPRRRARADGVRARGGGRAGPRHQRWRALPPGGHASRSPAAPRRGARFVDRRAELRALDAVLDAGGRPLTLVVGTAGAGKTTPALRWAHLNRDRFPDGQLYADLRGYDPGPPVAPQHALEGFPAALGVPRRRSPATPAAGRPSTVRCSPAPRRPRSSPPAGTGCRAWWLATAPAA
ncbi:DUF6879 family protein [Actinomadura parmotrematis]|uniref:DUF6879 family protein n=1 Tax=Actinomadura parmotrematis TaxID=2864039 RepID=UPI003558F8F7